MTTPSINNQTTMSSLPSTGRQHVKIERSYSPITDTIPLHFTLCKTPFISDKRILVNSAETSVRQDTPSPEFARLQRLYHYLVSIRDARDITANMAATAWKAWKQLYILMGRSIPVPDAAPGPDGQLLYAWNKEEHHLELEIFPVGPAEFFYLNRLTNETWEEEYYVGNPISHDAKDRLAVFM